MNLNQVVLITGASTGFGRLTAELLARKGYKVFASMRDIAGHNARNREELGALAASEKLDLHAVEMDVTDDGSVERCVRLASEQAGRIDVTINNAGFGSFGLTEAYTVADFKQIFETNFYGVVRVNRAVLPVMRKQGSGLLVHISSGAGRIAVAFMAPYCASKFALEALADAYRFELAPLGIDSVIVEPGQYRTSIFDKNMYPGDASRTAEYGPTGELPKRLSDRFMESLNGPLAQDPQEVASAILHLIETSPGKRPLRTRLGAGIQALEGLNQMSEEIRRGIMTDMFRMPELLELKVMQNL